MNLQDLKYINLFKIVIFNYKIQRSFWSAENLIIDASFKTECSWEYTERLRQNQFPERGKSIVLRFGISQSPVILCIIEQVDRRDLWR